MDNEQNKDEELKLTPTEYFDYIKDRKNKITDKDLEKFYDNSLILLDKYKITGQTRAAKKVIFLIETIQKERELVKLGVDTFVYQDSIVDFIENVASDVVKITELKDYERDIPEEAVKAVELTKDIFNKYYVVFTDYTGKEEKKIEKERRDKDPILFGAFASETRSGRGVDLSDRFYFLCDWEDEYCDLTLDKFVTQMTQNDKSTPLRNIKTPVDIEEFKEELLKLEDRENSFSFTMNSNKTKNKTFFSKVTSIFKKNK